MASFDPSCMISGGTSIPSLSPNSFMWSKDSESAEAGSCVVAASAATAGSAVNYTEFASDACSDICTYACSFGTVDVETGASG